MHFSLILVGAHDGSKSEQIIQSACTHGHVLLIEPVAWLFARLQNRFKHLENVRFCNCAVSTHDGEADFYAPLESANEIASWGDQLGSFNPTHAQEHDPRFIGKVSVNRVQAMTFMSRGAGTRAQPRRRHYLQARSTAGTTSRANNREPDGRKWPLSRKSAGLKAAAGTSM
jgi:FkbM family methyltransferase